MFRLLKRLFNNRPWKSVTTRKISFIYVLIMSTIIIVFGGILLVKTDTFDSATWMSESLDFLKWMLTTGVVVVLVKDTSSVIKFLKGYCSSDDIEDNE